MGVFIIAEAGVNHNGDIKLAKKLIDLASNAGADAIKFQTFKAEESTGVFADKADYQKENTKGISQLDMIKTLELPFEMFDELKKYAENKNIVFISTPDGIDSLNYLIQLGVSIIKIGSTEVTNLPFLEEIAKTGRKIILSTGMSTLGEIEQALNVIQKINNNIELMHCTTSYPTNYCEVNLKAMVTMRNAFNLPVGFSDHTTSNEAAISAVSLGATCIEKHITLDKDMPGPDHRASMNPAEFAEYVQAIRNTELLLGDGIKRPSVSEENIMKIVRRSILANEDLKCGTVLTKEMFCYKRPGNGIYPEFADILSGMKLNRDIKKEEIILWSDVKNI